MDAQKIYVALVLRTGSIITKPRGHKELVVGYNASILYRTVNEVGGQEQPIDVASTLDDMLIGLWDLIHLSYSGFAGHFERNWIYKYDIEAQVAILLDYSWNSEIQMGKLGPGVYVQLCDVLDDTDFR